MQKPQLELLGKAALVTGASSGIGRATALLLAESGAFVGLLGRDQGRLEQVANAIKEKGGDACSLVADISEPKQVEDAVERLVAMAGRLDVVFANAGTNGVWAPITQMKPEEWQRTIDVNLNGTFYTIHYAAPHLTNKGSSIVVCSSVNGNRVFSNTGASAYASSKSGQTALAKMLAIELGRQGIRVNVVCPGFIDTAIHDRGERRDLEDIQQPAQYPEGTNPLTRSAPGSPEQVAQVVLFLASDRASHVNGTEIYVDGGESLVRG